MSADSQDLQKKRAEALELAQEGGFRRSALLEREFQLDQVYQMLQRLNEISIDSSTEEYEMPWIVKGRQQMRADQIKNRASQATEQEYFVVPGDSRVSGAVE